MISRQIAIGVENRRFDLHAFVLMPDHVHLLLTPVGPATGRSILSGFKTQTATKANRFLRRTGLPFWQEGGGHDRNITTREEYMEKLTYIHLNPVRAKLVDKAADWRDSSASFYDSGDYDGPEITSLDVDFRW